MAERMIQVPESLIERNMAAARGQDWVQKWNVANELFAQLSQPTAAAEPKRGWDACPATAVHEPHEWNVAEGEVGYGSRCPGVAEPPRIEDMAPGTTFVADEWVQAKRFRKEPGTHWLTNMLDGVRGVHPDDLDSSTIRDVQPPKDAA